MSTDPDPIPLPIQPAFGHGPRGAMGSDEAIAVAAQAGAAGRYAPAAVQAGWGLEAAAPVTVAATGDGGDAVAGTLMGLGDGEIVVRRSDPRAGAVHVHFRRAGFRVREIKEARQGQEVKETKEPAR